MLLYVSTRVFIRLCKLGTTADLNELVDTFLTKWLQTTLSPYVWACLGIAAAFGFSVLGAAWYCMLGTLIYRGIWTTGSSLIGASVAAPRITSKNLISILFCEAVAIYGLIVAIIFGAKLEYVTDYSSDNYFTGTMSSTFDLAGYALFWAGLTVGLTDLVCGIAVGLVGATTAIADAQDRTLFVKILVIEIFASAVGIFGLIVGFIQASRAPSFG